MTRQNPADYVVGRDATIEDIDLDREEIHFQGERITEARAAEGSRSAIANLARRIALGRGSAR